MTGSCQLLPMPLASSRGHDEHIASRVPQGLRGRSGRRARLQYLKRVCPRTDSQGPRPPAAARPASRRGGIAAGGHGRCGLLRPAPRPGPRSRPEVSGKPVVLRERARRDIDEVVEHYLAEAGEAVALDFIDALEDARRQIGEQPASGSPRYAHELDVPGLRFSNRREVSESGLLRRQGGGYRYLARPARGAGHFRLDAGARRGMIRVMTTRPDGEQRSAILAIICAGGDSERRVAVD